MGNKVIAGLTDVVTHRDSEKCVIWRTAANAIGLIETLIAINQY